jgi:hypothetical protein
MNSSHYTPLAEFIIRKVGHLKYHAILSKIRDLMHETTAINLEVNGYATPDIEPTFKLRNVIFAGTKLHRSDKYIEDSKELEASIKALEDYVTFKCIKILSEIEHAENQQEFRIPACYLKIGCIFQSHHSQQIEPEVTFSELEPEQNMRMLQNQTNAFGVIVDHRESLTCYMSDSLEAFLLRVEELPQSTGLSWYHLVRPVADGIAVGYGMYLTLSIINMLFT